MRHPVSIARAGPIPLFAERPTHPFVPLGDPPAGARSEGQGRRPAGACALPLTAASTLAGWRRHGGGQAEKAAFLAIVIAMMSSAFMTAFASALQAQDRTAAVSAVDPIAAHIAEASQRFGIPESWIRAVLRAESAGDVHAISSAGAMGLMQVMPGTWADLRVRHRLGRDPYDPRDNILAGTAYLREMHDRYGNVSAMLAAYNTGPGRYDEYLSTGRTLPAETRAYVAAIAPQIGGGEITAPVIVAAADPRSWTRAPLFVAQSEREAAADPVQSGERSGDAPATALVRDVTALVPQPNGLFVARSGAGEPR